MELIKAANLAVRFILELCALAALGYWGFQTGHGTMSKVLFGIGAPLLAAVVWGTFVAPNAPVSISDKHRLMLELAVFASAAALYAVGQSRLVVLFVLTAAINRILMHVWGQ